MTKKPEIPAPSPSSVDVFGQLDRIQRSTAGSGDTDFLDGDDEEDDESPASTHVLKLYTASAQGLWTGRKAQGAQSAIPGYGVASRQIGRITRMAVEADPDPRAIQCLDQLERELRVITHDLSRFSEELQNRLRSTQSHGVHYRGLDLSNFKVQSFDATPRNAYARLLLEIAGDFDAQVMYARQAYHLGLITKDQNGKLKMRTSFMQPVYTILTYRFSGATRKDYLEGNARAIAAVQRFGEVPEAFITGSTKLQYVELPVTEMPVGMPSDNIKAAAEEVIESSDDG